VVTKCNSQAFFDFTSVLLDFVQYGEHAPYDSAVIPGDLRYEQAAASDYTRVEPIFSN
jgi:hypothetical protein